MAQEIPHLKYPIDIESSNLGTLLFMVKKYTSVASDRRRVSELTQKEAKNIHKLSVGSVAMYMPSISESYNTTWDFTLDTVDSAIRKGQELIKGSVKNTIQKETGLASANNEIATYTDVANRSHSFEFSFFPKSPDEAKEIAKIINFFRYHSLPDYSDKLVVEIPSVFEVVAIGLGGGFEETLKFKPMVLNSVGITYGEDNHIPLMEDGAISTINMNLQFTEIHRPMKSDFSEWSN